MANEKIKYIKYN